jgi:hypothetical protein
MHFGDNQIEFQEVIEREMIFPELANLHNGLFNIGGFFAHKLVHGIVIRFNVLDDGVDD